MMNIWMIVAGVIFLAWLIYQANRLGYAQGRLDEIHEQDKKAHDMMKGIWADGGRSEEEE